MRALLPALRILPAAFVVAALGAAGAEPSAREACERSTGYKPVLGQEGKDVIWLPTPGGRIERMLAMAGTGPRDFVVDLGAGDGVVAIVAARKFGARALGIEVEPELARFAQCLVRAEGVEDRVRVVEGDIFREDFSGADVVTMALLPKLNLCVRHRLLAMRPGVRVASYRFGMADWEPEETDGAGEQSIRLWVVPARVAGTWSFRNAGGFVPAFAVNLSQEFQKIGGGLRAGGASRPLLGASLRGDAIRFTFLDPSGLSRTVAGRVRDGEIRGELLVNGVVHAAVTGTRQGAPEPAPWAQPMPGCEHFLAR